MAKIELFQNTTIRCDGKRCDPLVLWAGNSACGDCPLIRFALDFTDIYFFKSVERERSPFYGMK